MEPPGVWKRVFDREAPTNPELEHRFAESYWRRFPGAGLPRPELEAYRGFSSPASGAGSQSFVPLASLSGL